MYEYEAKTLPDELLSAYFNNEANEQDKYIIKQLLKYDYNRDKYLKYKKIYENKFNGEDLLTSNIIYYPFGKKELTRTPKAGELWKLKNILPIVNNTIIEPVAKDRFVFVLSEPLPLENSEGYESENIDYYNFLALPVSLDIELATHHDYIVPSKNDLLGIGFMVITDFAFSVPFAALDKYIGTFNKQQVDEIINMHFFEYGAKFDKTIYENAKKGEFLEDDFGPKFTYRYIIEENYQDIIDYFGKLTEMFETKYITPAAVEYINHPTVKAAADDGKVTDIKSEQIELFKDSSHNIFIDVYETGEYYLTIVHNNSIFNGDTSFSIL
jgi:hypothetical protein